MPHRSSEQDKLIHALSDSFGDYHAHGADQERWLTQLVAVVARDERERCAALADKAGHGVLADRIRRG